MTEADHDQPHARAVIAVEYEHDTTAIDYSRELIGVEVATRRCPHCRVHPDVRNGYVGYHHLAGCRWRRPVRTAHQEGRVAMSRSQPPDGH
jgi:hypothetical protein